jgi:hypothetical protein
MNKYANPCNSPKSTGRFHLIPFQKFPQDFQQEEFSASFGIKTVGEIKPRSLFDGPLLISRPQFTFRVTCPIVLLKKSNNQRPGKNPGMSSESQLATTIRRLSIKVCERFIRVILPPSGRPDGSHPG